MIPGFEMFLKEGPKVVRVGVEGVSERVHREHIYEPIMLQFFKRLDKDGHIPLHDAARAGSRSKAVSVDYCFGVKLPTETTVMFESRHVTQSLLVNGSGQWRMSRSPQFAYMLDLQTELP
jgi:hypothetical protein